MLRRGAIALFLGALGGHSFADDFTWSGTWGTARTVSLGPSATYLQTQASGPSLHEAMELLYGDATTSPALAESGAASTAHARASLSIDESNASGIYVSGQLSAESSGAGYSSAADIRLTLLLDPADHATLLLPSLSLAATQGAASGEFFSLQIFRASADGTSLGAALLTLEGQSTIPSSIEFPTDSAHYLLTVTAHAEPGKAAPLDFAFNLDFGAPTAIPEPGVGALLLTGVVLLFRRRR